MQSNLQFVEENVSSIYNTSGYTEITNDVMEPSYKKRKYKCGGSDDDSDEIDGMGNPANMQGGQRQKKTKGRVKIKMEFIENKLRRYTTFSKRKTGIMKKVIVY